jgi:hypothetical protein
MVLIGPPSPPGGGPGSGNLRGGGTEKPLVVTRGGVKRNDGSWEKQKASEGAEC